MDGSNYDAAADIARRRAEYEAGPEFRAYRVTTIAEALTRCINKMAALDHDTTVAVLCAAAEGMGTGTPEYDAYNTGLNEDAALWADCASPHEIAAYMAAGLSRIDKKTFARNTRKRLIVAIWNSLPQEDRTGFLDYVQPPPGSRA